MTSGMSLSDTAKAAIKAKIGDPLRLSRRALDALYAHAHLETGGFSAPYLTQDDPVKGPATWSLYNRHKGLGRLGVADSDGYWTGRVRYVSAQDPDLRCYTDFYQSAQDMLQWLQEPGFRPCLEALQLGDVDGYFASLESVGFSTQVGYALALQDRFSEVII